MIAWQYTKVRLPAENLNSMPIHTTQEHDDGRSNHCQFPHPSAGLFDCARHAAMGADRLRPQLRLQPRWIALAPHSRRRATAAGGRLSRTPAAIERRLNDTGIEFFWLRPETNIRDSMPYLEAAARLGARNLLVGAADPDKSRFTKHWLELCDLAAAHDLHVSLEFIPLPKLSTIASYADAIDLIQTAPHPAAAVTIDSLHFFRAGSRVPRLLRSITHSSPKCSSVMRPPGIHHLKRWRDKPARTGCRPDTVTWI
jgi:hypothetical protein